MAEPIRVLVVDEDPDVLELTEVFLERKNDSIDVTTAKSPATAVDLVADESFDCVVSDFRMPDMDGIELFEAVREKDSAIPYFLFTAATEEMAGKEATEAGVTGIVQKGAGTAHYDELAERIEDAVR